MYSEDYEDHKLRSVSTRQFLLTKNLWLKPACVGLWFNVSASGTHAHTN